MTRRGEIDVDKMWEAYRENLVVTLPYVERLVDNLVGKTVITADHGQAFGEWGVYSHPSGVYLDVLRRVPWLVCDGEERKNITAGTASKDLMEYTVADVDDRLAALGYK